MGMGMATFLSSSLVLADMGFGGLPSFLLYSLGSCMYMYVDWA